MSKSYDIQYYKKKKDCDQDKGRLIFKSKNDMDKEYNVFRSEKQFMLEFLNKYIPPKTFYISPSSSNNKHYRDLLRPILNSKVYKIDKESVHNTFNYLFYRHKLAYFVSIRDNELKMFALVENNNYENPYYEQVKNAIKNKKKFPDDKIRKAKVTQCLVRFQHYDSSNIQYMHFYYYQMVTLIELLCNIRKIGDIDFFINFRDQNVIKENLTDPFDNIVGKNKMLNSHRYNKHCPIFSYAYVKSYLDIPMITPDDITRSIKGYINFDCNNPYIGYKIEYDWEKKISTAVFRGQGTGCGLDETDNQRINAAVLNNKWKSNDKYNEKNTIDGVPYLDAGVVRMPRRWKLVKGNLSRNKQVPLVQFLSMGDQSKYKYFLYLEGNSMAYRFAHMFSMKSVVIIPKTKYLPWFWLYLEDKINCIMIKDDLSDLADKITWLKRNDKLAQKIADNGYQLYLNKLRLEPMIEYMQWLLNRIGKDFSED